MSIFTSLLIRLYDVHTPVRSVQMKHLPAPWLTPEIKKLQNKKYMYKSKYAANPNDNNKRKYQGV